MFESENYLRTTQRTVAWFVKANLTNQLELSAPYQRNPVWTDNQKSYLIDSILQGLPIPELYMSSTTKESGEEVHTVIDGQQRIRACLDFVNDAFKLAGDEIASTIKGLSFSQLPEDKQAAIHQYKFVVRVLPPMSEPDIRRIFSRLNRNVVALNEQELRNATYWGPFIKIIQEISDNDEFWSSFGIFTANDHRRMLDHEFISELAIAYLHGPQNKKDKLNDYYKMYEENFERGDQLISDFRATTGEIRSLLANAEGRFRWRKKSDFYTLFSLMIKYADQFPWDRNKRDEIQSKLISFGQDVTNLLSSDDGTYAGASSEVVTYARAVVNAASDKQNRIAREQSLSRALGLSAACS